MTPSNESHLREEEYKKRFDDLIEVRLDNLEKQVKRILKCLELTKNLIDHVELKK